MNCKKVQPLLSAYVDQELTGADSLAVRDHLRTCAVCQYEADQIQSLKGMMSLKPVAIPDGLEARLNKAVFGRKDESINRIAVGAILAATSMAATLLAIHFAGNTVKTDDVQLSKRSSQRHLEPVADPAYSYSNDPVLVTIGNTGGR